MLNRIRKSRTMKFVRHQLLKINWLNHKVQALKAKQHHLNRELILSGRTMRDTNTEKSDHRTLATVADDGVLVDYMDGRFIGQRPVNPVYIDSNNWGGM